VALATLAGPWSAYAVSRSSQASRLEGLLTTQGMLLDGRIVASAADTAPFEVRREISATLRYLVETHGIRSLDDVSPELRLAAEAADTTVDRRVRSDDEITRVVVENALGLAYVNRFEASPEDYVNFYAVMNGRTVPLEGYDVLVRIELARADTTRVPIRGDTVAIAVSARPATLHIMHAGQDLASVPLWPLVDRARSEWMETIRSGAGPRSGAMPLEQRGEVDGLRYMILIGSLNGRGRGEQAEINSAAADILIAFTPRQ
jgi:hypothetical protein